MQDLKKLKEETLLDMLASNTQNFVNMMKNGYIQKDYDACKNMINMITAELESRKRSGKKDNTQPGAGAADKEMPVSE